MLKSVKKIIVSEIHWKGKKKLRKIKGEITYVPSVVGRDLKRFMTNFEKTFESYGKKLNCNVIGIKKSYNFCINSFYP